MLKGVFALFGYMPIKDHYADLRTETGILNNIVSDHTATIAELQNTIGVESRARIDAASEAATANAEVRRLMQLVEDREIKVIVFADKTAKVTELRVETNRGKLTLRRLMYSAGNVEAMTDAAKALAELTGATLQLP